MTSKLMQSITSKMVYPIPLEEIKKAKQQEKECGLIEVKNDEYRKELYRMLSWMYNYPGKKHGILHDVLDEKIIDFRRQEIISFGKKLLGKDWCCEELC